MKYRRQLAALMASGAVVIGMLGLSAGTVLADGQVAWNGTRGTDGNGNVSDVKCDESNTAYLYWVFTPGGNDSVESASITFSGTGNGTYPLNQDNGQWKLQDGPWFPLVGLGATVSYVGSTGSGDVHVTISHGCPGGGSEDTPPPSFEQSQVPDTDAPPTEKPPTEAPPSEVPSFEQSQAADTDAPTEPNTATVGSDGPAGPGNSSWLLIVALGLLLGSVVVMTPAKAKNR